VPLSLPHIPYDLTCDRTQTTPAGSLPESLRTNE
jgi:hypothetical protein